MVLTHKRVSTHDIRYIYCPHVLQLVSWDWLPTQNECRRDEFIFFLAFIYVPIGENFEVFWIIGIERAFRLLSVLCICSWSGVLRVAVPSCGTASWCCLFRGDLGTYSWPLVVYFRLLSL
jgi:hypothetical protein